MCRGISESNDDCVPERSKGTDLRSVVLHFAGSNPATVKFTRLAQLVERTTFNRVVMGSIPIPSVRAMMR
jgi:hypothetical protein